MKLPIFLVFALALSAVEGRAAPAKNAGLKTYKRKGYISFAAPKTAKIVEDWKAAVPGVSVEEADAAAGDVRTQVSFYPAGNRETPDLDAYTAQILKPNREFEKTVSSSAATLDGRPAVAFHVELLDVMYVTMRAGPKKVVVNDVLAADYAGGFAVVSFKCPQKTYDARVKEFQRFLGSLKLLVPKPAPPAVGISTGVVTSSGVPPRPR